MFFAESGASVVSPNQIVTTHSTFPFPQLQDVLANEHIHDFAFSRCQIVNRDTLETTSNNAETILGHVSFLSNRTRNQLHPDR